MLLARLDDAFRLATFILHDRQLAEDCAQEAALLAWRRRRSLRQQAEEAGHPNGGFLGEGTRLLGYGITADGQPTEYWISQDAADWTKLTLTGDTSAATTGQVTPFLMRDGILFSGSSGAWFGSASP
jgi:hypothetical protein